MCWLRLWLSGCGINRYASLHASKESRVVWRAVKIWMYVRAIVTLRVSKETVISMQENVHFTYYMIHTHILVHIHVNMCIYGCMHAQRDLQPEGLVKKGLSSDTHTNARTRTHTHTHTHAHTHTHTTAPHWNKNMSQFMCTRNIDTSCHTADIL